MSNIEFLKESMSNLIDKYGNLFEIPFKTDMGLNIKAEGYHSEPKRSWKNSKRFATLEISTFKGISFDAIHYYGELNIEGVSMISDENPNRITMSSSIEKEFPLSQNSYIFTLRRKISEKEIREFEDRYMFYSPGDFVENFNSTEDIINLFKEIKENMFVGEWEFFVKFPYKNEVINLNEFY